MAWETHQTIDSTRIRPTAVPNVFPHSLGHERSSSFESCRPCGVGKTPLDLWFLTPYRDVQTLVDDFWADVKEAAR